MDWTALKEYVRTNGTADDAFVGQCWAEAQALVNRHAGTSDVPVAVLERATLECGSELFNRRQAPSGIAQFAAFDGSAIRVARDPMVGAYPILAPWIAGGFA